MSALTAGWNYAFQRSLWNCSSGSFASSSAVTPALSATAAAKLLQLAFERWCAASLRCFGVQADKEIRS